MLSPFTGLASPKKLAAWLTGRSRKQRKQQPKPILKQAISVVSAYEEEEEEMERPFRRMRSPRNVTFDPSSNTVHTFDR